MILSAYYIIINYFAAEPSLMYLLRFYSIRQPLAHFSTASI